MFNPSELQEPLNSLDESLIESALETDLLALLPSEVVPGLSDLLQPLKTGDASAIVTSDGLEQSTTNSKDVNAGCSCMACQSTQSTINGQSSYSLDNYTTSTAENAPLQATPTSPSLVSTVSLSGQHGIDSLIDGQKWGGATGTGASLTYSFGEPGNSFYSLDAYPQPGGEPWNGFSPLTEIQKNATRKALAAWSDIANLQFTEVTDSETVAGDFRFAKSNNPSTAWAYTPNTSPIAGDVWFSHSSNYDTEAEGTYGYSGFLHEIGHALGLKHPHEASRSGVVADLSIDTTHSTLMSYRSYVGQDVNAGVGQNFFSTSPMLYDIAAIQYLYGANMSTRSGDTVYSWAPGQQIFEAIWDTGGTDTIDWSNQSSDAKINLGTGAWSELGPSYWNGQANQSQTLSIAYNVTIENAMGGSGNDNITGNSSNNSLWGQDGNDMLTGGAGADSFTFDSLAEGIDNISDFVREQGDKLLVSASGFGENLTVGVLSIKQFTIGSAAADASDRFIYNNGTGALFFDQDGIGSSAQVQFAQLSTGLNLVSSDISVFA